MNDVRRGARLNHNNTLTVAELDNTTGNLYRSQMITLLLYCRLARVVVFVEAE
jgi:hypothetical protein